MCNSALIFDLLGEELSGQLGDDVINLPNGCTLKISSNHPSQWLYEATTRCGKVFIGAKSTRCEAFDAAIDDLAIYIN